MHVVGDVDELGGHAEGVALAAHAAFEQGLHAELLANLARIEPLALDREHRCARGDRKSTRLNSSHVAISYAVFCLKKKRSSNCFLTSRQWCSRWPTT